MASAKKLRKQESVEERDRAAAAGKPSPRLRDGDKRHKAFGNMARDAQKVKQWEHQLPPPNGE